MTALAANLSYPIRQGLPRPRTTHHLRLVTESNVQELAQPRLGVDDASRLVRVLLIEGDQLGAKRVQRSLEDAQGNFEVILAQTVQEAQSEHGEKHFDLILCDLSQDDAGMDGFLRMQNQWKGVPVLVLTTPDDHFMGARAVMAGASGHILKSRIDMQGLMRSIRYAISRPAQTGDVSGRRISIEHLNASNDSIEQVVSLKPSRKPTLRLC